MGGGGGGEKKTDSPFCQRREDGRPETFKETQLHLKARPHSLSAKARPAERLVRRSVFGDGGAATGWGAVSERGARRAGGRGAVRG